MKSHKLARRLLELPDHDIMDQDGMDVVGVDVSSVDDEGSDEQRPVIALEFDD